jgi:hypothetical protein
MRGIHAQQLFEDAKAGVAGDVQGEQPGGADAAPVPEPHEHGREAEVPDQLVEERGVEGCVVRIALGPVGGVDLESPWEARRAAEQLLVEVVADAADRLGDQQSGRRGIEEGGDAGAASAQNPEPADQAGGEAPERDFLDELAAAAARLPAAGGDRDGGQHGEDVRQPVGVDEERTQVDAVA